MTIIQIEPLESGLHPIQAQSHRKKAWLPGYIEVPTHLESDVWATCGLCDLAIEKGKLVGIAASERPPASGPSTEEQIAILKDELAATDYQAIKYAEGWISEEEYASIRSARQGVRDKINDLEMNA